ncbi:MAG: hypothetical protein Q8Q60_04585 [Candidatus Chromulinivorax sp.]|nr:hypothetical protein [Candidatus Chromulinivorax sp.]
MKKYLACHRLENREFAPINESMISYDSNVTNLSELCNLLISYFNANNKNIFTDPLTFGPNSLFIRPDRREQMLYIGYYKARIFSEFYQNQDFLLTHSNQYNCCRISFENFRIFTQKWNSAQKSDSLYILIYENEQNWIDCITFPNKQSMYNTFIADNYSLHDRMSQKVICFYKIKEGAIFTVRYESNIGMEALKHGLEKELYDKAVSRAKKYESSILQNESTDLFYGKIVNDTNNKILYFFNKKDLELKRKQFPEINSEEYTNAVMHNSCKISYNNFNYLVKKWQLFENGKKDKMPYLIMYSNIHNWIDCKIFINEDEMYHFAEQIKSPHKHNSLSFINFIKLISQSFIILIKYLLN